MTDEIRTYRDRLAALKTEGESLAARRAALIAGPQTRSSAATEAAARALVAGADIGALTIAEPAQELREVEGAIAINRSAQDMLSRMVGLFELRRDLPAAGDSFRRYMAHVPRVAALLSALEQEFREVAVDAAAFDRDHGRISGLVVQHPSEQLPYSEGQLELLRFWWGDFRDDGTNPTMAQRWRQRASELGVEVS
jgi:hypothetical protein